VLIARDGGGRDDDPIPGEDIHLPVGGEGHAGQGGHGLPLTAGGDDAHPVLGQGLNLVQVHQHSIWDVHIAQLGGHLHGVLHAAASDRYPAAIAGGHIDDLLEPVHIACKGSDDDAFLTALEKCVKGIAHAALTAGIAGTLHVGGVGQQGQHPLVAQLAQPGQVDHAALDGGGVNLEVTGVDAGSHRALDGKGHRVGNGVVHMDEFHGEFAGLDHVARLAGDDLGLVQQPVLLQLQADQAGAHPGGIDGGVQGAEDIGQRADMVLVSVGDENPPDLVLVFDQVADVGDDHVDAVHVVIGETHATVYHHDS